MHLNRHRWLAAAALPLLLVAGCSSGSTEGGSTAAPSGTTSAAPGGSTPTTKSSPLTDLVVSSKGKNGPSIKLKHKPFSVAQTETKVVSAGSGKDVTKNQTLTVNYLIVNGANGKQLESNYGKSAATMDLSDRSLLPGLVKGLPGQKVGSKVVVAVPPADAFGTNGNSQLGVGGNDTLLFYVEIEKANTPLSKATGKKVAPKPGLPKVTYRDDKPAQITIPKKKDAPKDLVVQPLIKGKGPKVKSGQFVKVNYTGVIWRNGEVFGSSMGNGPYSFQVDGPQGVIAGWNKAVTGQPVGSRLLVVVPPDDGYGKKGRGQIRGTDTMVFVIDILSAN